MRARGAGGQGPQGGQRGRDLQGGRSRWPGHAHPRRRRAVPRAPGPLGRRGAQRVQGLRPQLARREDELQAPSQARAGRAGQAAAGRG